MWTGDLSDPKVMSTSVIGTTLFSTSINVASLRRSLDLVHECGKARHSGVVSSGDERRRTVIDRSITLPETWVRDAVA